MTAQEVRQISESKRSVRRWASRTIREMRQEKRIIARISRHAAKAQRNGRQSIVYSGFMSDNVRHTLRRSGFIVKFESCGFGEFRTVGFVITWAPTVTEKVPF